MGWNQEKWNLDRAPFLGERVVGVIAALANCTFLGFVSFAGVYALLIPDAQISSANIIFTAVTLVLLVLSLWLLYRIALTKGRKPSKDNLRWVSAIIPVIGSVTLALAFLPGLHAGQRSSLIGIGLIGVANGINLLRRSHRKD